MPSGPAPGQAPALARGVDELARSHARDSDVDPPERFEPTRAPSSSRLDVDLGSGEIRSMVCPLFGQESKTNRHYRQGGATRDDSGRQEQSERRQSPPKYDPSCIDSIRSDGDPHRQSLPFFIQRWCGES